MTDHAREAAEVCRCKCGEEVTVLAWWAKNAPIRVRLGEIWKSGYTQQWLAYAYPLEGNPHARMIQIDDVLSFAKE